MCSTPSRGRTFLLETGRSISLIPPSNEPLPIKKETHNKTHQGASSTPNVDVTVIFDRFQKPTRKDGSHRHTEKAKDLVDRKKLTVFGSGQKTGQNRQVSPHINRLGHKIQNKPKGEACLITDQKEVGEESEARKHHSHHADAERMKTIDQGSHQKKYRHLNERTPSPHFAKSV